MSGDEMSNLREQIALLQAQLFAQQDMLESEARRRIDLENRLLQAGIEIEQ